jgi:hypothetical protein
MMWMSSTNRHGLDPKDLDLPSGCRGGGRRRVFPDIVVHRRGTDKTNLLVIESRKKRTESRENATGQKSRP